MTPVVLVGSSSPPDAGSGINAYVNQLVAVLVSRGHRVIYAAPALTNPDYKLDALVTHLPCGQSDDPEAAAAVLLEAIRRFKVSIVINSDNPYLQAVAPWVDCVFVSIGHMARTSVAALACFNHQWVDYVVAISADMQRYFVSRFGLSTAKVPVIYSGVQDPYAGNLPAVAPRQSLVAIFAGGDGRNKGADLLQAAVGAGRLPSGVELHWFGHMSDRSRSRLQGLPRTTVYGRVSRDEFRARLRAADVLLLPSRTEGCPMAMLEAMSFGVIPLASDGRGAMQRLVIHGQEGFICRLSDWAWDMQASLNRLVSSPAFLAVMRDRTYQRFRTEFTADHMTDKLLALADLPQVSTADKPARLRLLRWHRPTLPGTSRAPLVDRACIRLGILRRAAFISE